MRSINSLTGPSIRRKSIKYFCIYIILLILFFVFVYNNVQLAMVQNFHSDDRISELHNIQQLPFARARFDNRRLIKIYDWMWTGNKWEDLMDKFDVCLSTQGSMDRIYWILNVIEYWQGPLSLAVYITSPEEWIGLNLLVNHFQKCYPMFRDFVSIHVAVPSAVKKFNMSDIIQTLVEEEASCENSEGFIQTVVDKYKPGDEAKSLMTVYPQNHMRNIARKGCGTEWVFSTDIDIIPRPGSSKQLQVFHDSEEAQNCKKCAFVVPTYELDTALPYPSSKVELIQHWNTSLAQPFHFNVFVEGHNATDYSRWSQTSLEEGPIKISHSSVEKLMKYYEPFYIGPDTIPAFEERFIGYGFTRSSQTQESLAEGWTFKVLTPTFSIHWGMQSMGTLISPGNKKSFRRQQTFDNSKIFKKFMKELEFRKSLQKSK